MEGNISEEEIEKILKSLEEITKFIGIEEVNPKEMIEINRNLIQSNREVIELAKEQSARWVDIYATTENNFCKILIKNLIDRNFITINELEKSTQEIIKQNNEYEKYL